MTRLPNQCYLEVNGERFEAWLSMSANTSIEQCASEFVMQVTRSDPVTASPIRIPRGSECRVYIGDTLITTGYIDRVELSHSAEKKTVTISGRSKTADIVDCSVQQSASKPATWKNRTVLQIATELCQPYGITVTCDIPDLSAIRSYTAAVGAKVFAVLEEICRSQRLLLTDTPEGNLLLTRIANQYGWTFTNPGNIKSGSAFADGSERYSHYVVMGQSVGNDDDWGELVSGVEAEIDDSGDIGRYRLLVITGEKAMTKADAIARAKWEAITRAGRSVGCTIEVCGWRGSDGAPYEKNRLCYVSDIDLDVDGELLLTGVEFLIDVQKGQISRLTFAPPGAYEPELPSSEVSKITKPVKLFEVADGVK
jgi:prophage tail gpP-like protein